MTSVPIKQQLNILALIKQEQGAHKEAYIPKTHIQQMYPISPVRGAALVFFILIVAALGFSVFFGTAILQKEYGIFPQNSTVPMLLGFGGYIAVALGATYLAGKTGLTAWMLANDLSKVYYSERRKYVQSARRKAKLYVRGRCKEEGIDIEAIHRESIQFNPILHRYRDGKSFLTQVYPSG